MIYRKRWPAGRKDPEDYTLVFDNMLRELLNGLGVNPVNTFQFNLFFRVYVVMVWLSKKGQVLLPGMGEGEQGHNLRRDVV